MNLIFPVSLNLVSSIKKRAGFKSEIIFLKVVNFECNPAALTPNNLMLFLILFELFLLRLLLFCFLCFPAHLIFRFFIFNDFLTAALSSLMPSENPSEILLDFQLYSQFLPFHH